MKFLDMDPFLGTRRTRKNRSRSPKTTLSGRNSRIVLLGHCKNEQKHCVFRSVFDRFWGLQKTQFQKFDHLELFLDFGTCFFAFYGFQRIDPCPEFFLNFNDTKFHRSKFDVTSSNTYDPIFTWMEL